MDKRQSTWSSPGSTSGTLQRLTWPLESTGKQGQWESVWIYCSKKRRLFNSRVSVKAPRLQYHQSRPRTICGVLPANHDGHCSYWWMQMALFAFICAVMGLSRYLWPPRIELYISPLVYIVWVEYAKPTSKKISWILGLPCKTRGKNAKLHLIVWEITNNRKHGYCQTSQKRKGPKPYKRTRWRVRKEAENIV